MTAPRSLDDLAAEAIRPERPARRQRRVQIDATVRLDAYRIIADAVERGVRCGWRRARKHTSKPGEDAVVEAIENAVVSELCEVMRWEDAP